MSKREVLFVCSGIDSNKLISEVICAKSSIEASSIFIEKYKINAQEIFGPFYKKNSKDIFIKTSALKFSSQNIKAQYKNWIVNAIVLKEPPDHAYLLFNRRIDGKDLPSPKGTIVVPISELRNIDEK